MTKLRSNSLILPGITCLGAMLRFWNFNELPFHHDELGVLIRLQFDSLHQLIIGGVQTDTHPAGIQVFIWLWAQIFGESEWVLKLPFTITGVLAIPLGYYATRNWFGTKAGLFVAAQIATTQYFILHSQMTRPYVTGVFLSLLLIVAFQRMIMSPKKPTWWWALFIMSAIGCAYNHHFSLLFAVIVSASGLLFFRGKILGYYLATGVLIFLAYTPHLNTFFIQLGKGGVGEWLAAPKLDFISEYLFYSVQFSWVASSCILIIIAASLLQKSTAKRQYISLCLAWFSIPLAIGYFYSTLFNPILQFSILIFSFPPLLMLAFSQVGNLHDRLFKTMLPLLLAVNTYTLVFEREHYHIMYNSIHEQLVKDIPANNTSYNLIEPKNLKTDIYIDRNKIQSEITWIDSLQPMKFKKLLQQVAQNFDTIYLGHTNKMDPVYTAMVQEYFSFQVWTNGYFIGSTYLFAKGHGLSDTVTLQNFESKPDWWNIQPESIDTDSTNNHIQQLNNEIEYSTTLETEIGQFSPKKNDILEISVKVNSFPKDAMLVADIQRDGEEVFWGSLEVSSFIDNKNPDWQRAYFTISLADIDYQDSDKIKVFVWNRGKETFAIDDFRIIKRKGNPYWYGWVSPIPN